MFNIDDLPYSVRRSIHIAGIALAYFLLAKISFAYDYNHSGFSPMWLPAGFALAMIFMSDELLAIGVWWGALFAHWSVFGQSSLSGSSLSLLCGGLAFINAMQALVGVHLLKRFIKGGYPLYKVSDVIVLVGVAILMGCLTATLGSILLCYFKIAPWKYFNSVFSNWWWSEAAGILIMAPMVWIARHIPFRIDLFRYRLEAGAWVAAIFLMCVFIFTGKGAISQTHMHSSFILLPMVVWFTYRLGHWAAIASVAIIAFLSVYGTTHGFGPFAYKNMNNSLLMMRFFNSVVAVTALTLAAALFERQKAQQELAKSHERFKALIENSCDALGLLSAQGLILFVSNSFKRLTGYEPHEYTGKSIFDLVHPDDLPSIQGEFSKLLSMSGETVYAQCRMVRRDKQVRWFEGTGQNLLDDTNMRAVVVNFRDVTDRKNADLVLRESEMRFRTLADTAPVMIWMSGVDSKCTFFNKSWLSFRGTAMEEEVGDGWLLGIHPDDRKRCVEIYAKSFQMHQQFTMDYRLLRFDGQYRWVLDTGVPRFAKEGQFAGYIGSCIDITERKMAEEVLRLDKKSLEALVEQRTQDLAQTKEELEHASRLADIGTLAATVAHELRNPLGVIQIAAHNLKRKNKELDDNQHLQNIEKKVWEGNQIIDNLLSYSRIKMPSFEQVNTVALMEECITHTQSRYGAQATTIKLFVADHQKADIEADSHQLREVFHNILNNAYQALSGSREGKVQVGIVPLDEGYLKITFQDNGPGISKEDLSLVFNPFFTKKAKGTGLGLTICNEILHLHHGSIDIDSLEGKGTTVRLILPIKQNAIVVSAVEKSQ